MVPAPKNLQFSEVGQTSFRASWDHGAPDVALYRIGWSKKGENNYESVSPPVASCWFQVKMLVHREMRSCWSCWRQFWSSAGQSVKV